jgi:hypothetical protein
MGEGAGRRSWENTVRNITREWIKAWDEEGRMQDEGARVTAEYSFFEDLFTKAGFLPSPGMSPELRGHLNDGLPDSFFLNIWVNAEAPLDGRRVAVNIEAEHAGLRMATWRARYDQMDQVIQGLYPYIWQLDFEEDMPQEVLDAMNNLGEDAKQLGDKAESLRGSSKKLE